MTEDQELRTAALQLLPTVLCVNLRYTNEENKIVRSHAVCGDIPLIGSNSAEFVQAVAGAHLCIKDVKELCLAAVKAALAFVRSFKNHDAERRRDQDREAYFCIEWGGKRVRLMSIEKNYSNKNKTRAFWRYSTRPRVIGTGEAMAAQLAEEIRLILKIKK